jgi:hypothetical protein
MEGLTAGLAVLVGLIVRVGVPIATTAVLVWLLRKLDARWQAEARAEVEQRLTQSQLASELRCWILKDCPEGTRENCLAYAQPGKPCWQVFRDGIGGMKEECLDCDVFRRAPVPTLA